MPKLPSAALLLCLLRAPTPSAGRTAAFPPGWNGRARTPPQGWRSWNAFSALINHTIIEANIKAISDKAWTVHGREGKVSLADLCAPLPPPSPHPTPPHSVAGRHLRWPPDSAAAGRRLFDAAGTSSSGSTRAGSNATRASPPAASSTTPAATP